jgi:hypothetical protein
MPHHGIVLKRNYLIEGWTVMTSEPGGERRKRGRPKGTFKGGLEDNFGVKVSVEYKAWLGGFAKFLKGEMSDVFREAMRKLAEDRGYRPPPLK